MKGISGALWITLSLLTGFQQALVYMHFTLNREVIEREFCINRDKPGLQCHGTCFLKKQLQKAGGDKESASIIIHPWIDSVSSVTTECGIKKQTIEIQSQLPGHKEATYQEPGLETFVPPPIARLIDLKESEILI